MTLHQAALVMTVPGRLDEEARRGHIGAVNSGSKRPDDPVDGVDKDISAVVAGWDLVGTVTRC